MRDRRGLKPLFRRRKLATLTSLDDNEGAQHFTEYVQRTMPLNYLTGENDMFYKRIFNQQDIANTNAGQNTFTIRPPAKQVWLFDRLIVAHTDVAARIFSVEDVQSSPPPVTVMSIGGASHLNVANGGVGNEQPIFPVFHDISGGVESDHIVGIEPLQLDNTHFVQLRGLGFLAAKTINIKYGYRRVR